MYKDIVVPVTGTPGDAAAIEAACCIARREGARVKVLEFLELPMPTANPWGLVPDLAMGEVYDQLRHDAEAAVDRRRTALAGIDVPCEVQLVEAVFTSAPRQAARVAHLADLVVLAGPCDGVAGGVAHDFAAAILLESGRPLLVVPPGGGAPSDGRGAVLAWREGKQCARALHDALPLLRRASSVDVVSVDPPGGPDVEEAVLASVVDHLVRHGLQARGVVEASGGRAVSAVLVEHARTMPAGLLVAGGYGHSRLREWVMGGATRELLLASPVPVLFSH